MSLIHFTKPLRDEPVSEPSALQKWRWEHPFWSCAGSSEDGVLFVKVYGGPKTWWVRGIIWPLYRVGTKINNAKWWLLWRFHPRHRYFMVNTGLGPGYHDHDERILHACMAMLCEFVKYDYHVPIPEALAIHQWWTVEKPADEARHNELLMKCYGREKRGTAEDHDELDRIDEKIRADETAMLHRLVDIRPGLWT